MTLCLEGSGVGDFPNIMIPKYVMRILNQEIGVKFEHWQCSAICFIKAETPAKNHLARMNPRI